VLPNTVLAGNAHAPSSEFAARLHFPGSILARFLELRGRRIVKDCGATWYAGQGALRSLPYGPCNPDPALRRMIRETGPSGALSLIGWTGLEAVST
jgi:hypothetical protein